MHRIGGSVFQGMMRSLQVVNIHCLTHHLTRLRQVPSWKVSAAMLTTLLFIVFVYLGAAEAFTAFLFPNPDEVASYFKTAGLPTQPYSPAPYFVEEVRQQLEARFGAKQLY